MSYLNNMGIERWRCKTPLPGAKRELQTQALLLSNANTPRLLLLCAQERCRPDTARLFDNLCSAIQITYGFTKTEVAFTQNEYPNIPTMLFADDSNALTAGLQDSITKRMWWTALNDMLCAST